MSLFNASLRMWVTLGVEPHNNCLAGNQKFFASFSSNNVSKTRNDNHWNRKFSLIINRVPSTQPMAKLTQSVCAKSVVQILRKPQRVRESGEGKMILTNRMRVMSLLSTWFRKRNIADAVVKGSSENNRSQHENVLTHLEQTIADFRLFHSDFPIWKCRL